MAWHARRNRNGALSGKGNWDIYHSLYGALRAGLSAVLTAGIAPLGVEFADESLPAAWPTSGETTRRYCVFGHELLTEHDVTAWVYHLGNGLGNAHSDQRAAHRRPHDRLYITPATRSRSISSAG